jgi:hypothetical protein
MSSLQMFFVLVLLTGAASAADVPQPPSQVVSAPAFTYCGARVLHLVIDGKPVPPAEKQRYVRCEPMMSEKLRREFSLDAALGQIVKAKFSQDGTTLYVTTK